ncbi:MAG: hypothetical protein DYH08_08360 [Actinobacteria bacterium ATB1]|nr:hypothetical protein [Actinobacteria bacterium ATB1]
MIAQPVNTATSLAYVVVGARLAAGRVNAGTRGRRLAGAALVMVGLGSAAYHGPGTRWGKVLHDVSLATMVAVVVLENARLVRVLRREGRTTSEVFVELGRTHARPAALLGAGLVFYVPTRTGKALCRPRSPLQGHGVWHLLTALGLGSWASRVSAATPEAP